MQTVYYIILVPMVYAAFGVFFFGTAHKTYSNVPKTEKSFNSDDFSGQGSALAAGAL